MLSAKLKLSIQLYPKSSPTRIMSDHAMEELRGRHSVTMRVTWIAEAAACFAAASILCVYVPAASYSAQDAHA